MPDQVDERKETKESQGKHKESKILEELEKNTQWNVIAQSILYNSILYNLLNLPRR